MVHGPMRISLTHANGSPSVSVAGGLQAIRGRRPGTRSHGPHRCTGCIRPRVLDIRHDDPYRVAALGPAVVKEVSRRERRPFVSVDVGGGDQVHDPSVSPRQPRHVGEEAQPVVHGGKVVECESRQDKTYTRLPRRSSDDGHAPKQLEAGAYPAPIGSETGRYVRRHDGTTR